MTASVKLFKNLYSFYKLYYTFKVLVTTLWLWGFATWINFWLTNKDFKKIKINGFIFILKGKSFLTELYELNVIIENLLYSNYLGPELDTKDGDSIIDIGAHLGSFCIPAAKRFPRSKVYAYEPEPENYNLLVKNIWLNGVTNIKVLNLAVSDSEGFCDLYLDPFNSSGHSLARKTDRSLKVMATTLDQIFSDNRIVYCGLLKIDCEGAEYSIILNTKKDTLSLIGNIGMEYHVSKFFDLSNATLLNKLIELLTNHGFKVVVKEENYQIGYLKALRKDRNYFSL